MAENLTEKYETLKKDYERLLESNQVLNERVLELYTLYNVSRTLSMSLQVNELFDIVMSVIGESLNVKQFALLLMDEDSGNLVIRASHAMPPRILENGFVVPGQGVTGKAAESKEPMHVADLSAQPDFVYGVRDDIRAGSYLGVPLQRLDGRVLGVLNCHKPGGGFGDAEIRLFKAVAEQVAIAIDHALTFQQTQELMSRDELTNLHNRRYFFERFEREVYRAKRYDRALSLIMIDIDHFKMFNDTYGHLRGDQALRKLARILEANLRKADVVARYGGEEFLILLPETTKDSAARVADKLRMATEAVNFNEDAPHLGASRLTITAGLAALPGDAEDALTLLDLADKALYYGKAKGRNRVCASIPPPEGPA